MSDDFHLIRTEDEALEYAASVIPRVEHENPFFRDLARCLFTEVLLHLIRNHGAARPQDAMAIASDGERLYDIVARHPHAHRFFGQLSHAGQTLAQVQDHIVRLLARVRR